MPRMALIAVLTLTMLVPPGMCLCRFAPCGPARAEQPVADKAAEGGCRRCAKKQECGDAEPRSGSRSFESSRPVPARDDHLPGCPAALDSVVRNVSVLADSTPILDFPAVEWLAPLTPPTPQAVAGAHPIAPFTSPPLFVAHCSLLI